MMIPSHCFNQIIFSGLKKNGKVCWLFVPKLNNKHLRERHKSIETHKYFRTCFPHFGTLFGLTKNAASIFLVEMDLLTMLKGKNKRVCSKVWDVQYTL